MLYECIAEMGGCGAVFDESEIKTTEVREDWGDVVCWVCPRCGAIEYEGIDLIVPAEE